MADRHSGLSEAQIIKVLESEEFYRTLRVKKMTEKDRLAIRGFISRSLTNSEWSEFEKHCIENELDAYYEMREIIFSTYAKTFGNLSTKNSQ